MSAYREAARLAVPLIISNISVPLLGMVDTAVVGHLPEPHHLGGVALGAIVATTLYFVCSFLRMGTTGLAAQAFGAGDATEMRAVLVRAGIVAAAAGLMIAAVYLPVAAVAEAAFEPTDDVAGSFRAYLMIRLLGAPAALGGFVLYGWLLGAQDARGPLMLLLFTNGTNAVLDVVLVTGLGYAAEGVAAATVIAEYLGLGFGLWLVRGRLRRIGGSFSPAVILEAKAFRRLIAINRDLLLRSLILETAILTFIALSSRQGEIVLAANAVLLNFMQLSAFGLDGFAFAAEAMVGRQIGAKSHTGFRAAVRAGFFWSVPLAVSIAAVFALAGPLVIRLMTGIPEVQAAAELYLPWLIAAPVVSVTAFMFDGVFFGATRARELRNGMAMALAVFLLAALVLPPLFANHGLWMALLILNVARGLILGLLFAHLERRRAFVGS